MTTQEVSAFLTGTVTSSQIGPQDCEYTNGTKILDVSVSVGRAKFDSYVQGLHGTSVSGIGDEATFAKSSNFLAFLKGQNVVGMQTSLSLAAQDDVTRFENLAKQAAGRA